MAEYAGSSPLTRGKQSPSRLFRKIGGLIPAHAGKTPILTRQTCKARAHPRSRGENTPMRSSDSRTGGSSPLTRGKPSAATFLSSGFGLIPAHAGKTHDRHGVLACEGAHPRSRGENSCDGLIVNRETGSSPLTRGKHPRRTRPAGNPRLIPAHAGKTDNHGGISTRGGAHPRSRGENP